MKDLTISHRKGDDMSEKVQKVIEDIRQLNVMDLVSIVDELAEEFGVSSAPVFTTGPLLPIIEVTKVEEQTEFTVNLVDFGANKISAIKALRSVITVSLMEGKTFVESLPKPIREGISQYEADSIKDVFEAIGATIEIV